MLRNRKTRTKSDNSKLKFFNQNTVNQVPESFKLLNDPDTNVVPESASSKARPGAISASNVTFMGISSTFLMQILSASSQALTVHSGIPSLGRNLCAGITNCAQGYVAEELPISQFKATVTQASQSLALGSAWQMMECLTPEMIGNALIKTLEGSTVNNSVISSYCTSQPLLFAGTQTIATATNLSNEVCEVFTSNFEVVAQTCMDYGKSTGYDFAIAGMFLAGGLVLSGIIASACLLKSSCKVNQSASEINDLKIERLKSKSAEAEFISKRLQNTNSQINNDDHPANRNGDSAIITMPSGNSSSSASWSGSNSSIQDSSEGNNSSIKPS